MAYNILDIEGIDSVYAEKLGAVNIKTVEQLLEVGATKKVAHHWLMKQESMKTHPSLGKHG
jgi:hypothetical protein